MQKVQHMRRIEISSLDYVFEQGRMKGRVFRDVLLENPRYARTIYREDSKIFQYSASMKNFVKNRLFERGWIKQKTPIGTFTFDKQAVKRVPAAKKDNSGKMLKVYKECIKSACYCYNEGLCRNTLVYCDADPR